MKWILFIHLVLTYPGASVATSTATIEFDSADACLNGRNVIMQQWGTGGKFSFAICLPKGK